MNDFDERLGIASFWRMFREMRPRLVGVADARAVDAVLTALRRIDPRLHFHLGRHDTELDIVLSAEGHPELMAVLERIEAGAPRKPGCGIVRALDADLALGRRNPSRFPRSATGDALFTLARDGDDLCGERDIDFSVVFRSRKDRDGCLRRLTKEGLGVAAGKTEDRASPWELVVKQRMPATHAAISAFETSLAAHFAPFSGQAHGWGCPARA